MSIRATAIPSTTTKSSEKPTAGSRTAAVVVMPKRGPLLLTREVTMGAEPNQSGAYAHRRNTCEDCGSRYEVDAVPPETCTVCGGRMIDPWRVALDEEEAR